jgi:hypothetical protein
MEMMHDARIVPLDGRLHLSPRIRHWLGDSRGRWEGDTLVVETTNFSEKTNYRGASSGLRLVERFTRLDANRMDYRFTVEDPTTFTKPFTAAVPMRKVAGPLYEYACHEGNYAMSGVLRGARAEEAQQR